MNIKISYILFPCVISTRVTVAAAVAEVSRAVNAWYYS
jgi:hypothetical protein